MTGRTALEARHLDHALRLPDGNRLHVLDDCSLTVRAGESVAVVGRSGSGKSTLLSLLGLLSTVQSGCLTIAGRPASAVRDAERTRLRRDHLGFVFQQFALIPHLSALDNVTLPALDGPRRHRQAARRRGGELLAAVGLGDRAHHRPAQLSGGEQQRVAIARALVNEPDVVLADEPTGALDETTAGEVLELLRDQTREHGSALVVVTHDAQVAAAADRTVGLQRGRLLGADA